MKVDDRRILTMTVTRTPALSKLRTSRMRKSRDTKKVWRTLLCWMQRAAQRRGRFISEPSLVLEFEYDPMHRVWFLYAHAYSVTDNAPEFLRRAKVDARSISVPLLPDLHIKKEVNG